MNAALPVLGGSAVAIAERAILVTGPSGSGKSTLCLELIDRGARLIGDDGTAAEVREDRVFLSPPPNIAGLIEVRNLGPIEFPVVRDIGLALVIELSAEAPRFIEQPSERKILGRAVPAILLETHSSSLAIKAELALRHYGLAA